MLLHGTAFFNLLFLRPFVQDPLQIITATLFDKKRHFFLFTDDMYFTHTQIQYGKTMDSFDTKTDSQAETWTMMYTAK